MNHRRLRVSETQYERVMKRDIKECDNDMAVNVNKRKREKIEIRSNF